MFAGLDPTVHGVAIRAACLAARVASLGRTMLTGDDADAATPVLATFGDTRAAWPQLDP
jgi:hypothetical protein